MEDQKLEIFVIGQTIFILRNIFKKFSLNLRPWFMVHKLVKSGELVASFLKMQKFCYNIFTHQGKLQTDYTHHNSRLMKHKLC